MNDQIDESLESYKETGFTQNIKKITNLDLLYSTIIGVLGGIISSLIPFSMLIKVWYPLTGGTQLVSGHHVIWASIIYGLTKKKPNILLAMVSKGLLEFLLGDPWGVLIIFVNIMEAFFLVMGFYLIYQSKMVFTLESLGSFFYICFHIWHIDSWFIR